MLSNAISVSKRFEKFLNNIALTDRQRADGEVKRESVCVTLNAHYYNTPSGRVNSFYIGSWAKFTRIRPPRDVDVLFVIPYSIYERFEQRSGNKQWQLLQEIKEVLLARFPRTDIRGDGPVVKVPFQSFAVELLPGFGLNGGKYWVPITSNGGYYKAIDPHSEAEYIKNSNDKTNNDTRNLIRMAKCWQGYCAVPIKSFHLELVAVKFLDNWAHAGKSKVYYDWMVRDFFNHLVNQANSMVFVPGTWEGMPLGEAWKSKAESAYDAAAKACEYKSENMPYSAGQEWQRYLELIC